jgi:hypothetical protein
MAASILEIVILGLKLIFMLLNGIMKYNAEEQKRFEDRLKTLSSALKAAVDNREESLNEEAYLSNLEWEKKQRYTAYKAKFLEVVKAGGGYVELSLASTMAMGTKVSQKKDAVIEILNKDMSVEDKSKLFAKLLAETA